MSELYFRKVTLPDGREIIINDSKFVKDSSGTKTIDEQSVPYTGALIENDVENNTATGDYSKAAGCSTEASGDYSHAEGYGTIATHRSQHVSGEFNIADSSPTEYSDRGEYAEIIGNGLSDNTRSNARTLDWEGNEKLAGGITLGAGSEEEIALTARQLFDLLAYNGLTKAKILSIFGYQEFQVEVIESNGTVSTINMIGTIERQTPPTVDAAVVDNAILMS